MATRRRSQTGPSIWTARALYDGVTTGGRSRCSARTTCSDRVRLPRGGIRARRSQEMIDEDMAHFARMGWDGLRLTFWGDWEASDRAGNLIANDHLDLQDYLIARARERGIYMLFSPIQLYDSNWPDALEDTTAPGFGRRFGKGKMGPTRRRWQRR